MTSDFDSELPFAVGYSSISEMAFDGERLALVRNDETVLVNGAESTKRYLAGSTAGLITEGVDGFVYRNDDPAQLSKVLAHAIEHPDQLAAMKADCRKLYERYYTNEAYVSTLVRLIRELTESR